MMSPAIKHEIFVFLLPLLSVFVKVLSKVSLANGKLFLGFLSHPDPLKVSFIARIIVSFLLPFISRKPEQIRVFCRKCVIVLREQRLLGLIFCGDKIDVNKMSDVCCCPFSS